MSDDNKKRRIRPWRFRLPLPRATGTSLGTFKSSSQWLKNAFNRSQATCPKCEKGVVTIEDVIGQDEKPLGKFAVCDHCDYSESFEDILAAKAGEISDMRKKERSHTRASFGVAILFGALSYFTGQIYTAIIGFVFMVMLYLSAVILNFRAWKITNRNILTAPIKDQIKAWWQDSSNN